MTDRNLASVALKTLGVYWLVQGLLHVERGVLMPFSDYPRTSAFVWGLGLVDWGLRGILLGVIGYVLTFRTTTVMKWIRVDGGQGATTSGAGREMSMEALAISLLGVYFLVPALGGMAPIALKLWSFREPTDKLMRDGYLEQAWPHVVGYVFQLILALVLIIGRNGLARLWRLSRPMVNE